MNMKRNNVAVRERAQLFASFLTIFAAITISNFLSSLIPVPFFAWEEFVNDN